jgi:hypothetical protein
MISFLSKKRTKEGFLEKISSEPQATKVNRIAAINNFERFVNSNSVLPNEIKSPLFPTISIIL